MGFARRREEGSRKVAAAVALVLAAALLAACGDDDGDGAAATTTSGNAAQATTQTTTEANTDEKSGSGGERDSGGGKWRELFIEAHPFGDIAFVWRTRAIKGGKVRLQFTNPSKVAHNLAVEDASGKTLAQTRTVTEETAFAAVKFKPGKYIFYCSVPGHREAGMEGTLIIR